MQKLNKITIVPMEEKHIESVYMIEYNSFSLPWSKKSIEDELKNKFAYYFTAIDETGCVCGYCGLWHVVTEGHITNIAVSPEKRRHGIGEKLVEQLIDLGYKKEMIGLTLEVRMNNTPAQALYAKKGFKPEGIRKNYYAETKEDAIVMWKYL